MDLDHDGRVSTTEWELFLRRLGGQENVEKALAFCEAKLLHRLERSLITTH